MKAEETEAEGRLIHDHRESHHQLAYPSFQVIFMQDSPDSLQVEQPRDGKTKAGSPGQAPPHYPDVWERPRGMRGPMQPAAARALAAVCRPPVHDFGPVIVSLGLFTDLKCV